MANSKSRNAILVLTYALLLVTVGWVVARFVAWQHEGWAGFYYAPAMPAGYKGKPVLFKPGSVSSVFSAGPAQSDGLAAGDVLLTVDGIPTSDWDQSAGSTINLEFMTRLSMKSSTRTARGGLYECGLPRRSGHARFK